jgi:hypothetical protein
MFKREAAKTDGRSGEWVPDGEVERHSLVELSGLRFVTLKYVAELGSISICKWLED